MQFEDARLSLLRIDARRNLRQYGHLRRIAQAVLPDLRGKIRLRVIADAQGQRGIEIVQRGTDLFLRAGASADRDDGVDLRRGTAEYETHLYGSVGRAAEKLRVGIVHGVGADGILSGDILHRLGQIGGDVAVIVPHADGPKLRPVPHEGEDGAAQLVAVAHERRLLLRLLRRRGAARLDMGLDGEIVFFDDAAAARCRQQQRQQHKSGPDTLQGPRLLPFFRVHCGHSA